ncbi:GNAT family N-acetyltransferase [Cognatishimia sp. 1_MG-2023]|uniref:GNAT family N-acetyltransferase n=1 Tax=Cognatishimia sp. 1_MG-2023 TaxID=3062642 RepID=UPI0026E25DF5|nr:GNAT family N-acetyltransferase [Cognatishimia sp. 1_MG-2023]MDO6728034.1 GNAT family N-acetyltransferase [Cognatishimia sp. 1_MG-2023]
MSQVTVAIADPRDPRATALLHRSHALMQSLFAEEDNHYLEVSELCAANISFFVAKKDETYLGCVALANKGHYGEMKSMFVDPATRGLGIGAALMQQLETEARAQGLVAIKLETGDTLHEAHRLYYRFGFSDCGPFGDYTASPASVFMMKSLT